jgi:hypothetical protein
VTWAGRIGIEIKLEPQCLEDLWPMQGSCSAMAHAPSRRLLSRGGRSIGRPGASAARPEPRAQLLQGRARFRYGHCWSSAYSPLLSELALELRAAHAQIPGELERFGD